MTATAARSQDRRRVILDSALRLFADKGLGGTSVAQIRARSGASVGSIYHHFGSKEGVARVLYAAAVAEYQQEAVGVLRAASDARSGVTGLVEHFLRWVERNPASARIMLAAEHAELRTLAAGDVAKLERRFTGDVRRWMDRHADELPDLAPDVFLCALFGGVHRFAQLWITRRTRTSIAEAASALATVAWEGLAALAADGR